MSHWSGYSKVNEVNADIAFTEEITDSFWGANSIKMRNKRIITGRVHCRRAEERPERAAQARHLFVFLEKGLIHCHTWGFGKLTCYKPGCVDFISIILPFCTDWDAKCNVCSFKSHLSTRRTGPFNMELDEKRYRNSNSSHEL